MKLLPGRLEKYLVNKIADQNKQKFGLSINDIVNRLVVHCEGKEQLPVRVVSFSGSSHFNDQLYSLGSFYFNVGLPSEWIIISDGSYGEIEIALLHQIPGVVIKNWFDFRGYTNKTLLEYGKKVPFGKRLHAYINLPVTLTTIYTDTDILFFPAMKDFLVGLSDDHNWFLADHGPTYMEPYYWQAVNNPMQHYLNAGFLVMNYNPAWQDALEYICNRQSFDEWGYLTEQVALNIMFDNDASSKCLDSKYFVFNNSDCFHLFHQPDYSKIAMRHFAGKQARVKMWQLNWKKILK